MASTSKNTHVRRREEERRLKSVSVKGSTVCAVGLLLDSWRTHEHVSHPTDEA